MSREFAFIDEYGDPNTNTQVQGTSTHFIIAAVLINENERPELEAQLEALRIKHFQTGEIKSSAVGSNDNRRLRILTDLAQLKYKYYAFVIDKRAILKDSGLIFKQPFLKFLHGMVYGKLYRAFPKLKVVADEHGTRNFMDGFHNYIEKNHIPDLFTSAEFVFSTQKSDPVLGISDFLAGSLARIFDPKKASTMGEKFLSVLGNGRMLIDEWPPALKTYCSHGHEKQDNPYDQLVDEQSMYRALEFLDRNISSNEEDVLLQIETLKYLIYYKNFVKPKAYISNDSIRAVLKEMTNIDVNPQYFRSSIIAKLRDQNVLIASSSKGYKLPVNVSDLRDFVEHTHMVIGPMVSRLKRAREQVLLSTKNKLDLLNDQSYAYLKVLLELRKDELIAEEDRPADNQLMS
ncbi:MAG TPA: DUF3800 domain-containing protein [Elusimicrobia bacterium]|nr:MAG: hypothetical protein A2278_04310 [Elusimicrobia bacterium RIFOXYA12_FULL_49_49]OGS10502.1 MAG: hypothetical protein A2386_05360 [Elusimicrobia bacterium RIFOXYB1_FULL_48_9]OGS14725.1 MAG: hypothetical protein A2251_09530 [Elusimicrobia bacterium RIFOXYA2_FULL_47_53]OGS25623.1 MAG: hypothetical protein A2339_06060 [Elusimicrobia bacterium RIFOXYB12_FULL_50_12]OGS31816.1 MAG: hypothetical protein A2323_06440 [Elusimicrobia bacterium RIFOXYB2_FULL_46_23]HBU69650.1 DUF3800 domain-containin